METVSDSLHWNFLGVIDIWHVWCSHVDIWPVGSFVYFVREKKRASISLTVGLILALISSTHSRATSIQESKTSVAKTRSAESNYVYVKEAVISLKSTNITIHLGALSQGSELPILDRVSRNLSPVFRSFEFQLVHVIGIWVRFLKALMAYWFMFYFFSLKIPICLSLLWHIICKLQLKSAIYSVLSFACMPCPVWDGSISCNNSYPYCRWSSVVLKIVQLVGLLKVSVSSSAIWKCHYYSNGTLLPLFSINCDRGRRA